MAFKIEDRNGLELTVYHLSKMYKRRDDALVAQHWDEETRKEQMESEVFMIRQLERQIAEFFQGVPLNDSNYPEIADTLRAMEEARRSRESVENMPAMPQKVG